MLPEKSYFSYFSPPCLLIQLYKLYACMLLDRCRCHRRRYSNTTSGHRYTAFDDCRMMMTLLTQYLHNALVRPHRSTSYRPIACYRRRSVVCRSVGQSVWALQKRLKRSKCRLGSGLGLQWTQGTNRVLDGVQIPTREGPIMRAKSGRRKTCLDMSGGRYTQSDSKTRQRLSKC